MNDTVLYTEDHSALSAVLTVVEASGRIHCYPLHDHISIGRYFSGCRCDIAVDSPIVSREHGEIFIKDGQFYYRDLDSTNGTYINNALYGRMAGKSICELSEGDVISFEIRQGERRHSQSVFCVFSMDGRTFERVLTIPLDDTMAELQIGRMADSGLLLDEPMISKQHASFFHTKNGWAIIDHQSTNGVFLNGKRMTSPRYLELYDVVKIVHTVFIFCGDRLICTGGVMMDQSAELAAKARAASPVQEARAAAPGQEIRRGQPAAAPVREVKKLQPAAAPLHVRSAAPRSEQSADLVINIVERSVVQRFKKLMLLQDIQMSVSNGDMVLILGGSGAGKTTFINAVMGYEKARGTITYNDTDIYEEYEQMKYEIGFVPQQDPLRTSDSVYDTLSNAAEMKLPKHISYEKRVANIAEVLERFGLSREKDSLVSKLSGGQKKRLSIAVEFIANPSLFFLDEPDSGIDDVMGRGLMETLREIADLGKIVMIITHSPERAADLFDKVIVLAKSTKDNCGHLAFYGGVQEAFDFFEVSAFREIVKKINRADENGEGLSDYFIEKYQAMQRGEQV